MAEPPRKDLSVVRGKLLEIGDETIVLAIPATSYQLHLAVDAKPQGEPGDPVEGRIHARAKKIDPIRSGGRYIEPCMGRPRRLQGRVVAGDTVNRTLTVLCGAPFVASLTREDQSPADFPPGSMVSFDIERGAKFVTLKVERQAVQQPSPSSPAPPMAPDKPA